MAHNIGGNRELLIDNALIDTARTTAQEVLHHPVRRECVMTNSAPWEADGWVYYTLIQEQGFIRMYYLCMPMYNREHTRHDPPFHHICYAESTDGVHWNKPELGICEINGSTRNNVIVLSETMDAFHVFLDKNPACPRDERYKAVLTRPHRQLWCMLSEDGVHFRIGWMLSDNGVFDSYNTAFWDERLGRYVCYMRDFHDGANGERIRDIRRIESTDLKTGLSRSASAIPILPTIFTCTPTACSLISARRSCMWPSPPAIPSARNGRPIMMRSAARSIVNGACSSIHATAWL